MKAQDNSQKSHLKQSKNSKSSIIPARKGKIENPINWFHIFFYKRNEKIATQIEAEYKEEKKMEQ